MRHLDRSKREELIAKYCELSFVRAIRLREPASHTTEGIIPIQSDIGGHCTCTTPALSLFQLKPRKGRLLIRDL